jgi:hypothetical protein
MPQRRLREVLRELHQSLDRSPDLDAESRAELERTAREIQEALDRDEAEEETASELFSDWSESLSRALERFEDNHPRLTDVVNRLSTALADLGI